MNSVVGLDVGSMNSVIAVARQGGIETVANEYSKRQTPSFISFGDSLREMGTSGQQKLITNFKQTAWLFKHLIGRPFSDELVQKVGKFIPYTLYENPETGRVAIKTSHNEQNYTFAVEQVMAMLLTKLKSIASKNMDNREVKDCVIAVPFYLTNVERAAWLEAATIANLNCLKLINETTAIALAYGIFKTDLPEQGKDSRVVAFVDIGYTSTQVVIAAFNKGVLKVLATSGDRTLGGLDFDMALSDHFAAELKVGKFKVDVSKNKRAQIRLLKECERLKKLMSSNATKMSMNVECIMDDKDVSGHMKRDEFEQICETKGYLNQFRAVLNDALKQLNPKYTINFVEMVGGSHRIPIIEKIIQETFNLTPGKTLNAEEAVARGAALQCAILSPAFKVREFSIQDAQPHPIRIDWEGTDGKSGNALLFTKNEGIPLSKVLTFSRKETSDFTISASYVQEGFNAHPQTHIGNYIVKGIKEPTKLPNEEKETGIKLKVKLRMDKNGMLIIPQAVQIDKQEVLEKVKPKKEETKKEETKEETLKDKKDESDPANKTENKTETVENKENGKMDTEEPKMEKVVKPVKIDLNCENLIVGRLSNEILTKYIEQELDLSLMDKKEQERREAKNKVESFVYDNRENLGGLYEEFATEDEIDNIRASLTKTEDWLYEDGENEKRQAYEDKYKLLSDSMQPIVFRFNEYNNRSAIIEALNQQMGQVGLFLQKYQSKDEAFIHIDVVEVEKVQKSLNEVTSWSGMAIQKLRSLNKSDTPDILVKDFTEKLVNLKAQTDSIMKTPKPAPKKKEKVEEKKPTSPESGDNKEQTKEEEKPKETAAETMDLD